MRTVLLSKSDELYLQKCAAEQRFAYGIIIGQHAEPDKYVVVHLAKNSEEDVDMLDTHDHCTAHCIQKVEDIDTQALTNQWVSANKMIPGSFDVFGVFVTSLNKDIVDENTFTIAKKLLYDVQNLLHQSNNICSTPDAIFNADYLFLAYSTTDKKLVCKSYANSTNGGTFTALESRVVEKSFEWHTFECSYELDDVFPILDPTQKINIEHQFQKTVTAVKKNLDASEIFIQNESVDDSLTLEAYIKIKRSGRRKSEPLETFKATIFLPVKCQIHERPIKVREFNGTIRFSGVISSRIWCNPKNTIGDVKRFVREDILRSLAARIQVYCDGLTEPNISQAAIFISEPPRRVYFNLHNGGGGGNVHGGAIAAIQFSEYIFRGEAPTVAVAQAKQILDLDINTENIVDDLEGLPEDVSFSDMSSEMQSVTSDITTVTSRDLTRTMYMLGVAVSLLVLLVSILLHYVLRQ